MKKRIITISREFGSGGRFIGEEVAKKLGIAYYDKDIIGQIAEQSGLSPEVLNFICGLGGRDVTKENLNQMFDAMLRALEGEKQERIQYLNVRCAL